MAGKPTPPGFRFFRTALEIILRAARELENAWEEYRIDTATAKQTEEGVEFEILSDVEEAAPSSPAAKSETSSPDNVLA